MAVDPPWLGRSPVDGRHVALVPNFIRVRRGLRPAYGFSKTDARARAARPDLPLREARIGAHAATLPRTTVPCARVDQRMRSRARWGACVPRADWIALAAAGGGRAGKAAVAVPAVASSLRAVPSAGVEERVRARALWRRIGARVRVARRSRIATSTGRASHANPARARRTCDCPTRSVRSYGAGASAARPTLAASRTSATRTQLAEAEVVTRSSARDQNQRRRRNECKTKMR